MGILARLAVLLALIAATLSAFASPVAGVAQGAFPVGYNTQCPNLSGGTCVYHRQFGPGQPPIDAFWNPWQFSDGGYLQWENYNNACLTAGTISTNPVSGALTIQPSYIANGGSVTCYNPGQGTNLTTTLLTGAMQSSQWYAHSWRWRVDGIIPVYPGNNSSPVSNVGSDNILWAWQAGDGGSCQQPIWPLGHFSSSCVASALRYEETDLLEAYNYSFLVLDTYFHLWQRTSGGAYFNPTVNIGSTWAATNTQRHVYVSQIVADTSITATIDGVLSFQQFISDDAGVPMMASFPIIQANTQGQPDASTPGGLPPIQIFEMELVQDAP
jgi:hypothetical protein